MKFHLSLKSHLFPASFPVAAYVVQYIFSLYRGGSFDCEWVNDLNQSLGVDALKEEPLSSLAGLHIQPPGLNGLFALALRTQNYCLTLQLTYCVLTICTIILLYLMAHMLFNSKKIASTISMIYALLPSTTLYSLYPYNTTLMVFSIAVTSFAVVLFEKSKKIGYVLWLLGLLLIFLFKASMFFVIALVSGLLLPIFHRIPFRKIVKNYAVFAFLILIFQAHYFLNFGMLSTSSWGATNVLHAMIKHGAINEMELEKVTKSDECFRTMPYNVLWVGDISNVDDSCFDESRKPEFNRFLTEGQKGHSRLDWPAYQLNTESRLNLEKSTQRLLLSLLREDPSAILQMLVGVNGSVSNLELSVVPPHNFYFVAGNLRAGAPLNSIMRPFASLISPTLLLFSLVYCILIFYLMVKKRKVFQNRIPEVLLFLYLLIFGVLIARDENQRYLFEIYPIMMLLTMRIIRQFKDSVRS